MNNAAPAQAIPAKDEVFFINAGLQDLSTLLNGLPEGADVVLLDESKNGLQQMAEYLEGRQGLTAIHLLSHGAPGTVQLGNTWLSSANLAEHQAELQSIGAALKADGDLMLYGCKVGESAQGQAFIYQLASITGADVAASADDTGAASLGGNWTLERSIGSIETTALGAQLEGYTAVMAAQFSGGADTNAPALGVGALSRMVVGDFNGDERDDILFQTANTVNAPWKFAAGKFGGGFIIVDRTDSTSPFRNLGSMIDMANTGSNYYAADFDNDGDIDLLGVTASNGSAFLYRNNNGVFESTPPTGFGGAQFGSRLVVGDFNADGAADILYQPGTVDALNSWRYALNNGNGTFTDVAQSASPFASFALPTYSNFNYRVIDFEGDGDLDIIYMVAANPASLFLNNGNGTFALGAGGNIPIATFSQRSIFGDFDGDGDADMFWQIGANGTDWNYAENLGNGTFAPTVSRANSPFKNLTMVDFGTTNFRIGDFDGDGDTDLLGTMASVGASVYYQDGTSPKLLSSTPVDNSGAVSPSANIVLTFDQAVSKGSGNIYIVRTSDNSVIQTIGVDTSAVSGTGTTWTIDPPADLVGGVAYAVRIDTKTFVNASGKVYVGIQTNTELNFVTSSIASPVITGLDGDSITYTEKGAPVLIDPTGNAEVTDADSLNFSGGTLTVTINSGRVNSEDLLGVMHQGTGAGQIGVSGSLIYYSNNVVGIATGGTGSNPLVINFNSLATPTVVSALLQRLSYSNSNTTDIGTGARNIQVTLADGTGGVSNVANISLAITAVNDAPTATITASNLTFTEGGSAVAVFSNTAVSPVEASQRIDEIVFRVLNVGNSSSERLRIDGTDVFLSNGNSVSTLTNSLSIAVAYNSGTAEVTISSTAGLTAAAVNALVNGMTYANDSKAPIGSSRSVELVSVRDNGGGSNTTNVGTASAVTLVPVNDSPTLAGGPYVLTGTSEDFSSTGVQINTVLAGLTYSDPDSGALLGAAVTATTGNGNWQFSLNGVTAWTAFGTVANSTALLLTGTTFVRYTPDSANGETATLTLRAWDHTTGTASSVSIPRTGDTSIAGGSTAYSSGTATASLTVTNANDAPLLNAASPTLPGLSDDAINNAGVLVSSLYSNNFTDVDSSAVKGIAITSLNAGNGTWQYSLDGTTWSNVGVVSVSSALLLRSSDHVRFVPDGVNGTTADFTFRAWDRTGITNGMQGTKANASTAGGSTAFSIGFNTANITVTAVNDAPTLTGSGGGLTWTEGNNTTSIPVVIDDGLTITDADGPNIASATVRISNNYSNGNDFLELVSNPATMGNIIGTWDAANATLTLGSAGNLASQAQFQAALRAVTFTNLSESPTLGARTVELRANDGSLDSTGVTRTITMSAVDDTPVISVPASTQVLEDVASVINLINISDPDSVNVYMALNVGSGTLAATSGAGVVVGGNATTMNLSGTIAAVNAFLANNRLTYTTAANATADATLTITVDSGGGGTDTKTVTLAVTPVNDAPVATVPVSLTVTEDVPGGVTGISFSDVDAGSGSVTVTFSAPSGTLSAVSGSGVTVGDSGTATLTLSGTLSDINAFIAASSVKYLTALDNTSSVLLTVSINDNENTGGTARTDTKTVILNVIAVNDAPVNSVPGSQIVGQGNPLVFNSLKGNLISVSDVDIGSASIQVTLTATHGTLTLSSATGLSFTFGDSSADATMTFSGTLSAVNSALNGLIFTPATGYSGPATITLTTNDSGGTGSGGALSDTDVIAITVSPPPEPEPEPVKPTEPTKPEVPVLVDGALVSTQTAADGSTITTITPVTANRTDDPNTPNSGLADIPLIIAPNGQPIVQVSLPVGVGLQSQGQANALNGGAALTELALRIQAVSGNAQLLSNGQSFMEGVDASTPLHVQTITVSTGTGFNPAVPLVISGSSLPQDGKQAIVLDARALPSGSVIQVDNIDFIVMVGNVRLIGGAGQNMAAGDDGAQWIVLGADDDVLHGGGGNDTVGSKGGNDQIYGDAGDDIVFGGAGNDLLSGGSGSDRLNGGTGFDVAIQEGKRTDYTVTLDGAGIKLTHVASGVSDWLVDVEQVRFDTGPSLTLAHSAAEEAAAFLFQQWMGRDLTQSEGAVIQTLDGLSAVQVADLFAQVFPQQAGGRTAQQLLEGMETAGAIRVDADRSTKYVGDAGDNTFTPTLGMAWNVDGGAGIDTLVFPATLAQTYIDASTTGFTLQRMADGAVLELINVERLTFSDTKLALDLDGHAGQAAKLLGALGGAGWLDNKPLVGEVIRALDAGVSAESLAQLGLQVLGAKTSLEVTQLIWTNVVGSAATPAQLQPFVDLMAQGVTGGELAVLASNLDLNATRIDLVGLAATGIEFA